MGLVILVLFLLAWVVVLGGPPLVRALRGRRSGGPTSLASAFDSFGRRAPRPRRQRPRRFGAGAAAVPRFDPELPAVPDPRHDIPMVPAVVSVQRERSIVSVEVRRRRVVLGFVSAAGVVLLLAVVTGSLALWGLQLAIDILLALYTVALVRQARSHELGEPAEPKQWPRPRRRMALPVAAVVAAGVLVFGTVLIAGGDDGGSNSATDSSVEGRSKETRTSPTSVTTVRASTTSLAPSTLAPTTVPPTTSPLATVATAPPAPRPTFPARPLPPITEAPAPVVVPTPVTQPPPPPTTQPPNLLCLLLGLC